MSFLKFKYKAELKTSSKTQFEGLSSLESVGSGDEQRVAGEHFSGSSASTAAVAPSPREAPQGQAPPTVETRVGEQQPAGETEFEKGLWGRARRKRKRAVKERSQNESETKKRFRVVAREGKHDKCKTGMDTERKQVRYPSQEQPRNTTDEKGAGGCPQLTL